MAERTIKTVLEISGEGSYRNKLKEIGQALKGVASEERALSAEYGKSDSSLGKLVQQQSLLENKLKLQKERMEAVRQEYERVVQAEGENSSSAKRLAIEYNNTSAQVATTERSLRDLNGQIEKSSGAWNKMSGWIGKNDQKLQKFGNTVSKVAGKINKVLTAATTAFATYATKSFMDFEDQMAVVSTLVDTTEVDMAEMSDKALAASNATGQAASEIAKATYSAISAGVDPAHAVSVVEAAAKGAKAGLSDTETVIDGLTTSVNAWGLAYEDSEKILDKMITTQNFGKTTLGELSANMGKVTAFAPQVGVSLEEVLAATAALTKSGYSTESAMTALKNVMSAVIKPTSQAKEAAKEMGLQFDASAMRSKGLVGFLQEVIDKTHGDEEALGKLFGSVEGLGGVMLLAGGAAKDFSGALDAISGSAGALDSAFNKRTSSRAEQLSMSLNKLKNAAIGFGQTLAPYIDMAAGAIDKLAEKLGSLSENERKGLLNTAAWMIGITGSLSVVGKLTANLKNIVTVLGSVGKGFKALTTASAGLKAIGALAGAGGVLAGAVAGIAGIGAAIYGVGYAVDQMKAHTQIKNAFGDLTIDTEKIDAVKSKAQEVRDALAAMYAQEAQFSTDTNSFFDDYISWLSDGLPETQEQVDGMKERFATLVQTPYDAIEQAYNTRKQQLDEALASGVISKELYESQMQRLETETEEAKGKVSGLQEQFEIFTDGAVAANTALNEDQIGILNGLKDQIIEVTNGILEANNQALQAAELSKKRVQQGEGTAEDFALATTAAQVEYELGHEQRTTAKEAVELEIRTQLDETADEKTRQELQGQLEDLEQTYQETEAEAEASLNQTLNDMSTAMLQQYPELLGQMQEVAERTNLAESVYEAISGDLDAGQLQELAKQMGKAFDPSMWMNGDTLAEGEVKELFRGWADEWQQGTAEMIEGMDQDQLGEAMTTLIAGLDGHMGELDFSNLSDELSAALTVLDLTDDGRTIGMQLANGEVEGVGEGDEAVQAAMQAHSQAVIDAAKDIYGVQSPSTVFAEIGRNLMEGLRNGIGNNRRLITAALTQLSTQLRNAGRQSMQGWINGVNGMRTALIAAYASAAQAAAQAAREALDVHSPSRVFAQIGAYTAEGMIAGLNSRVGEVQTAMERMVNPPQPRRNTAGRNDGQATATVNNYYTYNMPYTGAFGAREARKASRELARVETARKTGKGA